MGRGALRKQRQERTSESFRQLKEAAEQWSGENEPLDAALEELKEALAAEGRSLGEAARTGRAEELAADVLRLRQYRHDARLQDTAKRVLVEVAATRSSGERALSPAGLVYLEEFVDLLLSGEPAETQRKQAESLKRWGTLKPPRSAENGGSDPFKEHMRRFALWSRPQGLPEELRGPLYGRKIAESDWRALPTDLRAQLCRHVFKREMVGRDAQWVIESLSERSVEPATIEELQKALSVRWGLAE